MINTAISGIPLILLAAGASSRMGTPKGLLDFNGRFWMQVQIRAFAKCGGIDVIIVLGSHLKEYVQKLDLEFTLNVWQNCENCRVLLLKNRETDSVPFVSQQLAFDAILREPKLKKCKFAYLMPIDVPLPSSQLLFDMRKIFETNELNYEALVLEDGGHPVLLSRTFMQEMCKLDRCDSEARLDFQLRHKAEKDQLLYVKTADPRPKLNLNKPSDWKKYCDSNQKSLHPGAEFVEIRNA
jgi:CTP:molybdopterin cytidylyltransferase MocA